MAESVIVTFLKRRRAEIAGRLEQAQESLEELLTALDSVDATLRMVAPDIDLSAIKASRVRLPNPVPSNETARIALAELRKATEPLSTRALAIRVMELRGLNPESRTLVRTIRRRVHSALEASRRRGLVIADNRGPVAGLFWRVVK